MLQMSWIRWTTAAMELAPALMQRQRVSLTGLFELG